MWELPPNARWARCMLQWNRFSELVILSCAGGFIAQVIKLKCASITDACLLGRELNISAFVHSLHSGSSGFNACRGTAPEWPSLSDNGTDPHQVTIEERNEWEELFMVETKRLSKMKHRC